MSLHVNLAPFLKPHPPPPAPLVCILADTDETRTQNKGLVLLVILLASMARCLSRSESCSDTDMPNGSAPFPEKLRAVYIVSAHPFPEVDAFVASSSSEYHLDTARFMLPMKEGLEVFLEENPTIQAIFVGTRRTDPHCEKLKPFDPTDSGWPSVMRLHSILDWR